MAGVLLVSAEPEQQNRLIEWLRAAPYQLEVTSEPEAIWPWLVETSASPRLILLDDNAPSSSSVALTQEIKAHAPAVEVIILAEPQKKVEVLRAGAYGCLSNPPDLAELELVLDRAVDYCYLKAQAAEAGDKDQAANLYSQEADKIRRLELLTQTSEGARKQLDILYQELRKAHHTAKIVAEVTTLETLDNTLHLVAAGTRDALNCDAVTLYGYSPLKESLIYPPIMVGVHFPEKASSRPDIPKNHLALEILKRDRPYIAEDVGADPLFAMTRFARDQGIASCMVIPLKVGAEPLGVMFVNYRSLHQFTLEELANIELFAHQAAVAIHNAQQYEELRRVKMLVGARTGLAWLGMANSIWRHATDKHALTIREQIQLLRRNLLQIELKDQKIIDRLAMIERLANKIIEKP
jgi:GAF domain-containing protein